MAQWRYILWAVNALAGLATWRLATAQGTVTGAVRGQLRGANRSCLVAEADGTVAGYVVVQPATPLPENAHVHGIAGLAVAPPAPGEEEWPAPCSPPPSSTRARGARKLSLRVLSTSEAALRLYERRGFRREGTLREEFLINGRYVDDVLMARHLDATPGHMRRKRPPG